MAPRSPQGSTRGRCPCKVLEGHDGVRLCPALGNANPPVPVGSHQAPPSWGAAPDPPAPAVPSLAGVGVSGLRRAARSSGLQAGCDANGTLGKGRPGSEWLPRDGGVGRDTRPPECTRPGHAAENSSFRARALGRPAACRVSGFPGCGHVSHCDAPTPGPTGERQRVPSCAGRWPR